MRHRHIRNVEYDAIKLFEKLEIPYRFDGEFIGFDCPFCHHPFILLSTKEEHINTAYCPTCVGTGIYSILPIVSKIKNLSYAEAREVMTDCTREGNAWIDLPRAS